MAPLHVATLTVFMIADIALSSQKPLIITTLFFYNLQRINLTVKRVIPVDFSDDLSIYSRLSDELSDLNVGVLGKQRVKEGRERGRWRKGRRE